MDHETLSQFTLSDETVGAALSRFLVVAQHLLPHRPDVSITVVQAERPSTLTSSGELARRLDQRQYDDGAGPCLSAAATGEQFSLLTSSPPERYRSFAEAAAAAGVEQVLSLGLAAAGTASLNIYYAAPHRFDSRSQWAADNIVGYLSAFLVTLELFRYRTAGPDDRHPGQLARDEPALVAAHHQYSPSAAIDHLVDWSRRPQARPPAVDLAPDADRRRR